APMPDGALLRDAVRHQGVRAILAVPLVSKDALVGVLSVAWEEAHTYDEREVRLLAGLAQQAAVALDRARVHSAAVRRADELGALLRAARTVMAGLDPLATLEQIVHEAAGIAGTPHVKLLIVDPEARTLRVGALTGAPVPADFSLALGAGHSGRVAATGEPLFVHDLANDARNALRERDREAGMVTYLGLPIRSRDRVLGVLSFNTTTPRRYSPAELEYLGSFADLAGIALENARLYDEAQRALADLKAVQQKLVQGETLRALGELAGGAAHHLNNLLTIVVGRVQLLLRGAEDERLRRPLAIIEKAAKDGAEVVRRLQQFSRTHQLGRAQPLSLDDVARDVLGLTRGHWQDGARARGVSIEVENRLAGATTVDDEHEVREALAEMLQNHGHTVLTATGADEALARFESEPDLDLVLTDLVMPGRTGWDVAAGVKARRPRVAVGLITGWGDTTDVD